MSGVLLGCAAFTAVGLVMVFAADSSASILIGLVTVVFFGGGGLYAGPKLLGGHATLEIGADGIRPRDGGFLPWSNIAATGSAHLQGAVECFAVRIDDYAEYAATFSDEERSRLRAVGRVTGGRGSDVGRMLAWNRKKTGWDLVWPRSTLDRRTEDLVALCDEFTASSP